MLTVNGRYPTSKAVVMRQQLNNMGAIASVTGSQLPLERDQPGPPTLPINGYGDYCTGHGATHHSCLMLQ